MKTGFFDLIPMGLGMSEPSEFAREFSQLPRGIAPSNSAIAQSSRHLVTMAYGMIYFLMQAAQAGVLAAALFSVVNTINADCEEDDFCSGPYNYQ